jgi:hypothetical protein
MSKAYSFPAMLLLLASGAHASFVNGSFETPAISANSYLIVNEALVTGWHTTATDHMIELWSTGFLGVPAYRGSQFTEINANMPATLYQDFAAVPLGYHYLFQFAHRGRSTTESIRFIITDLGVDGLPGGGNDTVLFSRDVSDGTSAWRFYTSASEPPIPSLGHAVRVSFQSLVTGSVGNFLDDADFFAVPEPSTFALVGVSLALLASRRGRCAPVPRSRR